MKVSKKTEYGLRAMVAIAVMAGVTEPISLRAVAEAEEIPEQFLDQIVSKLRKAGFVTSVRGVNGGYMLSRPAEEIPMGALVRVLEGSLSPISCISDEVGTSGDFCSRLAACRTRNVWLRVMQAVTEALDSISLAQVMEEDVSVQEILG